MEDAGAGARSSARAAQNETSRIRTLEKKRRISGPPVSRGPRQARFSLAGVLSRFSLAGVLWRQAEPWPRSLARGPAAEATGADHVLAPSFALQSPKTPWPARPQPPEPSQTQRHTRR